LYLERVREIIRWVIIVLKNLLIFCFRLIFSISQLYGLLVRRTFVLLILYAIIYYLLFYRFSIAQFQADINQENEMFLAKIFKYVHIFQANDEVVMQIISSGTKFLSVVFSVILTLFIFSHREQRAIAPSSTYRFYKNYIFLFFLSLLMITMPYGFHLSLIYKSSLHTQYSELGITITYFGRFVTWIILFLFSIVLIGYTIVSLFRTININWLLPVTIQQVRSTLINLEVVLDNRWFRKTRINEYNELNFNIESVYQMLEYAAENNMSKDYYDNIEKLRETFSILKKEHFYYKSSSVYASFYNRDQEEFRSFHRSVLKNTLSLATALYKNNKFNKGQKALDLLFSLYSDKIPPVLRHDYIASIYELIQLTDLKNGAKVRAILNGLETMKTEYTLILYQALILRIISENNIQLLTSVVYSMKKNIDRNIKPNNGGIPRIELIINKALKRKYKLLNIGILLQCMVKSIELSHYACTGFLIKFLVTNFSGKLVKEAFNALLNNGMVFGTIYPNMGENVHLDIDYYFNEKTYDYCLKKLCILLYGQQRYAVRNGLSFIEEFHKESYEYIDIGSAFVECDYKEYIFTKVLSAGKKYGFLYLKDKEFLRDLAKDFGVQTLLMEELLPDL